MRHRAMPRWSVDPRSLKATDFFLEPAVRD